MSAVCVVGLGYIGLPTAAMLASHGHSVVGCDIRPAVVALVNAGQAQFPEPDLDILLAAAVRTGRLRAQATPSHADFFIIAAPTPLDADRTPDLSAVAAAADAIAPLLRPGDTVILESTSPVGTTEMLAARLQASRPDLVLPRLGAESPPGGIHLAHCPERILPGRMLRELVENDRIIGGLGAGCARRAAVVYERFVRGEVRLTDCRTAEFVKLAENAFRDVNIAFANELALICDRMGLDVWQAIALANRHPRVNVLRPSAGVGGHCIAVDPWFLVAGAPAQARLIRTAREVNDARPRHVAAQIRDAAAGLARPVVACLGLTYKPDVDDLRESPALDITRDLAAGGGMEVLACDPWVTTLPGLSLVTLDEAVARADVVAILVAHKAFRGLDREVLRGKRLVDPAGLLSGMQPARETA